jgi:hypothetical protein
VAISALRPGDRPIRALFMYGTNCASIAGCGYANPLAGRVDFGLVTFSYPGNTHSAYVYVMADAFGRPQLGGTLSPSPPPLMSEPSLNPSGD